MTDIVKRIREGYVWVGALQECADEIERLRGKVASFEKSVDELVAAARSDTLEEAAKVAEQGWEGFNEMGDNPFMLGAYQNAREVAAAIRALKEKSDD